MENLGRNFVSEKLWLNMERLGDVTFSVGPDEEQVKASLFVLRSMSPVFDKKFDENWKSQNGNEIKLPDIKPKEFRLFLKLMMVEQLTTVHLRYLSLKETLHLLCIANKYDVSGIQSVCREAIQMKMTPRNVTRAYETLRSMNEPELEDMVFSYLKKHIHDFLNEVSFSQLSKDGFKKILGCDAIDIGELALFQAVIRWTKFQCKNRELEITGENMRKVLGDLLYLIRFPLIDHQDLFKIVQPLGILTAEELIQVFRSISLKGDPTFVDDSPFNSNHRSNRVNQARVRVRNVDTELVDWRSLPVLLFDPKRLRTSQKRKK